MIEDYVGVMAYLVGGPADDREIWVSSSSLSMTMPEWVDHERRVRTHEYKPCPETGEWLWQGGR